ncbi:putative OsmC-like protein [Actinoplanes lutulentus]|uniref:OsmC-like protein n=1 Tax=Actinoplanes lutulentus TaxID=1287878 RepID=A0A327ZLW7_9ACTN|nr:OsmC family protein [Actinoplanes lutulentus]MBB2940796.1 putative OsmC-like protein [Actinoplanes lutulentus]RAK43106.1 OsmC-like protein [Actinoplanes lutulentus]
MDQFGVVVSAGSLQDDAGAGVVRFPHRWTDAGVTVRADFTGAHLLHLAAAGCVLNDLYREAAGLGIPLDGVRVTAAGAFDTTTWTSTGITYTVELDSPGNDGVLAGLLARVDEIAEIPRAIRAGAQVTRNSSNGASNAAPL